MDVRRRGFRRIIIAFSKNVILSKTMEMYNKTLSEWWIYRFEYLLFSFNQDGIVGGGLNFNDVIYILELRAFHFLQRNITCLGRSIRPERERFVKYIHARGSLRWRICHRQWAHPLNNNLTVTVACSTVTVTKCQAALHTLQAFPFFRPTCLCREPHVDPDCNSFQNFLFDHPCIYVLKKGKFNVKRAIIFSILPSWTNFPTLFQIPFKLWSLV